MKTLTSLLLACVSASMVVGNPYGPEQSPLKPTYGFSDSGFDSGLWYSHTGPGYVLQGNTSYSGRYLSVQLTRNTSGDIYSYIRSKYPFAIVSSVDYRTSGYPTYAGNMVFQSRMLTNNAATSVSLVEGSVRLGNGLPLTQYVTGAGTYNVSWTFNNSAGSSSLAGKLESPNYVPILPADVIWVQRTAAGDYICVSNASWICGGSITLQGYKRVEIWPLGTPAPFNLEDVSVTPWNPISQTKSWFVPVNPDGTYTYVAYEVALAGGWFEGDPHYPSVVTAKDGVYTVNVYVE